MRRQRRIKAAAASSAVPSLDSLSDAQLAALAREKGLAGVPETWKRETLLRKLGAV